MSTVLYAEDDPEHRSMVKFALQNTEITLLQAINGEEAVEMITERRPDLILLDLFMPIMDGFGVMREIKSNTGTSQIPIIVLSAWPTGDNRQRAKAAGADTFVAKPYDPQELVDLIKTYLERQDRQEKDELLINLLKDIDL